MSYGECHFFCLKLKDVRASNGLARSIGGKPCLLAVLLSVAVHGPVYPALAPAPIQDAKNQPAPATGTADVLPQDNRGLAWFLPPVRLGGSVSYSVARNYSDGQSANQSGLVTTLNARTGTYIWRPWFATVNASLAFTHSANRFGNIDSSSKSKSVAVNGGGQLNVVPLSKFPFEAHFQLNDSRATTDQLVGTTYASERFGFTQRYFREDGDALLGWDRNIQHDVVTGRDTQDTLQLRITTKLGEHDLQFNGDRSDNRRDSTGEKAIVNSLALQHSYAPDPTISISNFFNVSQSNYELLSGGSGSRLVQLSSNAFWRSENSPLTVNGGVRMFAVDSDLTGLSVVGSPANNKTVNANANLGINYEFSRFTRLSASLNVNQNENNGLKSISSSQQAAVNYAPDNLMFGDFSYRWGTSAGVSSNQTSNADSQTQLSLQFNHSLSRSIRLSGGSAVGMDVSQGVAFNLGGQSDALNPVATKQLTHSGSLSWDFPQVSGAPQFRLSASDSRSLDGPRDFYQMINFQTSSNLATGPNSSWSGNLTVQSVRQGKDSLPSASTNAPINVSDPDFVTNSSGSVNYQNQRTFGVRRLRFTSDLRLNGQSLLPVFGGSKVQELAAWQNSLDYSIGRTQLRLNFLISSMGLPQITIGSTTQTQRVRSVSKSIMFTVSRSFGD